MRPFPPAAEGSDADHWALLADTHIAADRDLVHLGARMADNLTRVVAAVTERKPRPAGVLLDGDGAFNKGELGDYRLLGEMQVRHYHEPSRRAPYSVDRVLRSQNEEHSVSE